MIRMLKLLFFRFILYINKTNNYNIHSLFIGECMYCANKRKEVNALTRKAQSISLPKYWQR